MRANSSPRPHFAVRTACFVNAITKMKDTYDTAGLTI